jgi:hypothetical protein
VASQQANSTKTKIYPIRRIPNKELRAHERSEAVTDRISRDLKEHGTFFKSPEGHFYFRRSDSPKLFSIEADIALGAMIGARPLLPISPRQPFDNGRAI